MILSRSSVPVLWLLAVMFATRVPCCAQGTKPASPPAASAATSPARPFSPALAVGDTLYLSGHLGLDPATGHAPADPQFEAQMVLASLGKSLQSAGYSMDDLVSVEIYCTDLRLYDTFNRVYSGLLHTPYPARDFIGVKDLLFGAHFEVMGVAVRNAAATKTIPVKR